jgi:acetyltransferase EpsM
MKNLIILGFGGHSKVIIDTALRNDITNLELFDDNPLTHNTFYYSYRVKGIITSSYNGSALIAVGNNYMRQKISRRVKVFNWESLIHPSAYVANDVEIGEGSVIFAGAVVQPGSKIGKHCIINTGACIDHDCVLEDFIHIAPNCALGGNVRIGEGTFIGIGSSIIHNITIGKWASIGAGSVVITDQPNFCTSVGIPAKPIKFNE